jgi:DNA-binding LacI/PurR family transcriptional regulator
VNDDHDVFSYAQTRQLLRGAVRPLAVVASDLSLLFGSLRALREAGLEDDKDFSLGGVTSDGMDPMYDFLPGCITLAVWSVKEMGRVAGELLRQRMQAPASGHARYRTVRIPCRILERDGSHLAVASASGHKE